MILELVLEVSDIYVEIKSILLKMKGGCNTHPHNTYAGVLVSNGLIGFFIINFGLLYVIREIFVCRNIINSSKRV